MITISDIHAVIVNIVTDLVAEDYEKVYKNDYKKIGTASDLKDVLDDYPGNISRFPEEAFDAMRVYKRSEIEYDIDFPLWYDGERSDLTLVCNIQYIDKVVRYSIEDMLVQ